MAMVIFLISSHVVISQDKYYCQLGPQPLVKCDSIVSVKFDPLTPLPDYGAFATEIEALDENIAPIEVENKFVIYSVQEGYDIDTLIDQLKNESAVMYAFPAFKDTFNNLFTLNDVFVISYYDGISSSTIDSIEDEIGVEIIEGPLEFTGTRVMRITPQFDGNTLEAANIFYESGLVKYSQPCMFRPTLDQFEPNDPLFQYQYNLYNYGQTGGTIGIDIDIRKAWEITMGVEDVVVAILDDGFTRYHEDIDMSRILWNWGYDYIGDNYKVIIPDNDPSPGPTESHGVACQGIILAITNNLKGVAGIASNCSLLPIKCFDDDGHGTSWTSVYEQSISHALHYAIQENGQMVISCSWSYEPGTYIDNIAAVIDSVDAMGIPIVFSTGNLGEYYGIGNSVGFPASLPKTIGAGAIRKTGEHWNYSGSGVGINVVAPSGYWYGYDAGDIYTLDQMGSLGWNPGSVTCLESGENYMCTFGGTSAAAPQVAGILALLRSKNPYLFGQYTWILNNSARDGIGDQYDTTGWDPLYGFGLASALRALLAISRGDVNCSGSLNMLDIIYIINYAYKSGPEPIPDVLMADVNCNGGIDVLDVNYLIDYLYRGGPAPQICFEYGD